MGHKPSDLGPLPSNWKSVKFGSITKVRQGLQIAISDRLTLPTSTSKEYITIQSINRQNQDREYVESPSNRVICKTDDVLMTRTGNTGIVVTGVEGAFHNNFFLIDFDRKTIDGTFLINYLRSPRVQYVILTKAGASTIPDLNHKDFYAIEFPLAPLPEQKKIAKILSTWDQAISTTEQLLANSQQQKKALMQQLLTGKKRLLDENGVRFSGEWKLSSVDRFIKESRIPGNNGDTAKKLTVKLYGNGVVAKDEKRAGSESTKYYARKAGQFIYSKLDFLNGAFGLIPDSLDGFESTLDLPAFDFLDTVCVRWFIYFVSREEFYTSNLGLANGGRKARRVNPIDFLKIVIPTPRLDEQQKIASVLTAADEEIATLQRKLDCLKQEKKALMQQLLTGKRRVNIEQKELHN